MSGSGPTEKGILVSQDRKTNLRDSALLALESVDLGHRAEALSVRFQGRNASFHAPSLSPALLILDELLFQTRSKRAEEIYELIRHVHEKHHLTVIAVEHNSKPCGATRPDSPN